MALTVDPKATVRILRMADHLIQFPVVRAAADLIEEQDAKLTALRELSAAMSDAEDSRYVAFSDPTFVARAILAILDGGASDG